MPLPRRDSSSTLPSASAPTSAFANAFTLVELLVVIGIIAVLISILLPSLARARAQAVSAQCKSNLRQFGIAWTNYAANNKGWIFTGSYTNAVSGGNLVTYWYAQKDTSVSPAAVDINQGYLHPYLPSGGVRDCPATLDYVWATGMDAAVADSPVAYGYSVSVINSAKMTIAGPLYIGTPNNRVNVSQIRTSAETFWWGDAATVSLSGAATPVISRFGVLDAYNVPSIAFTATGKPSSFHGRHTGKGNVLWFDGHVSEETPVYAYPDVKTDVTSRFRRSMKVGDLVPPGTKLTDTRAGYYFWKNKAAASW